MSEKKKHGSGPLQESYLLFKKEVRLWATVEAKREAGTMLFKFLIRQRRKLSSYLCRFYRKARQRQLMDNRAREEDQWC